MSNLHKRALALSGGGGRGAYHVGVYKYLEEQGLKPKVRTSPIAFRITATNVKRGKLLEKVNQRIAEGRARPDHYHVHLHVIAPSATIPAAWILSYKPEQTDYLIQLGYADARRMLSGPVKAD